jgi:hypothetical protein
MCRLRATVWCRKQSSILHIHNDNDETRLLMAMAVEDFVDDFLAG